MLINDKMPTIVGILTFMSIMNLMLSRVEHEKCFITSGPGPIYSSQRFLFTCTWTNIFLVLGQVQSLPFIHTSIVVDFFSRNKAQNNDGE